MHIYWKEIAPGGDFTKRKSYFFTSIAYRHLVVLWKTVELLKELNGSLNIFKKA